MAYTLFTPSHAVPPAPPSGTHFKAAQRAGRPGGEAFDEAGGKVPLIKWEIRVLLEHLLEQGLSRAAIARQLCINCRTINRWLIEGQLDREV